MELAGGDHPQAQDLRGTTTLNQERDLVAMELAGEECLQAQELKGMIILNRV